MSEEISESLVRKLLSQVTEQKATNEAVALVGEFLKMFLQEAHHRASIEVNMYLHFVFTLYFSHICIIYI